MSEIARQLPQANLAQRLIPRNALKVAGVGAATLVTALGGSSAAEAHKSTSPNKAPVLTQVEDLPGYGIRATDEVQDDLKQSAIKFYYGYTDEQGANNVPIRTDGNGFCSGNKVKPQGQKNTFASLAAHCLSSLTGRKFGLLDQTDFPQNSNALNFFDTAKAMGTTYNVTDPTDYVQRRQPLGTAYGISISTRESDSALLQIAPNEPAAYGINQPKRQYKDIKALEPISVPADKGNGLIPGQEVAMYAGSAINLDKPVARKGRYIGSISRGVYDDTTVKFNTQRLDIVLVKSKRPYTDPCYYGDSGSSAGASATTYKETESGIQKPVAIAGKTYLLGALSARANLIYDPYVAPFYIKDSPNEKSFLIKAAKSERAFIRNVESQLGVDVPEDVTVCGYSSMNNQNYQDLINGFKVDAPVTVTAGKGGGNVGQK